MCDPVSIGMMITAMTAKAVNTRQTMKRKDRELAIGIGKQGELDKEAAERVNEEITALGASNPEVEKAAAVAGFKDTLRASQDLTAEAQPDVFGASERFAEDLGQSKQGVDARAAGRAELLSKIDAPGRQRQTEAVGRGQLSSDIGQFADRSQMEHFLSTLKASEHRNNPFVDIIADVVSGVASGGVTSGAAGVAKAGAGKGVADFFQDRIANLGFLGDPNS